MDDAVADDLEAVDDQNRQRAERGKLLAEFLVGILDSFERSTTRKQVVSAFGRAGLFYNRPDPHDTHWRVTYVDPSKARPLVNATGLFARRIPVERSARGHIKIIDEYSNTEPSHARVRRALARERRRASCCWAAKRVTKNTKLTHRRAQLRLKARRVPPAPSRSPASAGRSSGSPEASRSPTTR